MGNEISSQIDRVEATIVWSPLPDCNKKESILLNPTSLYIFPIINFGSTTCISFILLKISSSVGLLKSNFCCPSYCIIHCFHFKYKSFISVSSDELPIVFKTLYFPELLHEHLQSLIYSFFPHKHR